MFTWPCGKTRSLASRKLGVKMAKVGHCGTLDPMATGRGLHSSTIQLNLSRF
jgi:hypothetical protein